MSVVIEQPRAPRSRNQANLEKYGWLYMRASGVLLVILILSGGRFRGSDLFLDPLHSGIGNLHDQNIPIGIDNESRNPIPFSIDQSDRVRFFRIKPAAPKMGRLSDSVKKRLFERLFSKSNHVAQNRASLIEHCKAQLLSSGGENFSDVPICK